MPIVLDDVAGVVGITNVAVKLLDACIRGFTVLREARHAGRDLSTVQAMLQIEQLKLQTWASEVGLLDIEPRLSISISDVGIASVALDQLGELLTDLDKLKHKYKLNLEVTEEEIAKLQEPQSTLKALLPFQREQFRNDTAKVFHRRQSTWRRLRWVSVNEQLFRKLLKDVKYFIDELTQTLGRSERDSLKNRIEMFHRFLITGSSDSQYLSIAGQVSSTETSDTNVEAAARLRKQALELEVIDDPHVDRAPSGDLELQNLHGRPGPMQSTSGKHASGSIPSMRLSKTKINAGLFRLEVPRQLAYYVDHKSAVVLLEWMAADWSVHNSTRDRVNKVSKLLHELFHPSFHSLRCIGYLEDNKLCRYGIVYEVPLPSVQIHTPARLYVARAAAARDAFPVTSVTLRSMLEATDCPSLNVRVKVAILLLETILQLHTSGWLHKAITSDNLITFAPRNLVSTSPLTSLETDSVIYLTGYNYARSDDPAEMTEPSLSQIDAELYRHPLSLGTSRQRYCRAFDLFSVGCILLELGLWSSLSSVFLEAHATAGQSSQRPSRPTNEISSLLLTSKHSLVSQIASEHDEMPARDSEPLGRIVRKLHVAVGENYTNLTLNCLRAINGSDEDRERDDYHDQGMIQLESDCLTQLRRMVSSI
ncbi:hypothetical protein LTR70_010385 [Exophiala xenobiotica]|uniref:Prion-inhibition and propagation HeLo domain-containing protein n=1 Tax=Lithohypha guttulata TaxID=1690604 RepID=A0ABR0K474_9EURO|nr:hypothetical protein LTR24_007003 [Lithohypha guttulata]KAK5309329.1 hypothetical protein LTR70_010385 [Exophiala xenobiotica]